METMFRSGKIYRKRKIIVDEIELIKQVALRPLLYDSSLKCKVGESRNKLWREVSSLVNVSEEECRKRWRSLRDSFIKCYKADCKMKSLGLNKQIKWIFYDEMQFLIPYLEIPTDYDQAIEESMSMAPNRHFKVLSETQEETMPHESIELEADSNFVANLLHEGEPTSPLGFFPNSTPSSRVASPVIKNEPAVRKTTFQKRRSEWNSDEKFLLSCAPALQRLSKQKNALARLKIQQLLYDIEFNS